MFEYIKECLNEYESVVNGEGAKFGWSHLREKEKDIIEYLDLHIAKAIMKEKYVDAEKIAKIILATKDLSNEITVKVE